MSSDPIGARVKGGKGLSQACDRLDVHGSLERLPSSPCPPLHRRFIEATLRVVLRDDLGCGGGLLRELVFQHSRNAGMEALALALEQAAYDVLPKAQPGGA